MLLHKLWLLKKHMGIRSNKQNRKRKDGVMVQMSRQEFEEAVADALDQIPPRLTDLIDNVVILVEDDQPSETPKLLGLYVGIPLTERGASRGLGNLLDRIMICRNPTLRVCHARD